MIAETARRLGTLGGWRRFAFAFVAGAVTIFAFPPFSVVPVLWISFPVLLWLLDGCKSGRAAAAVGWAFGFGHFCTSFYWITYSFYVDAATFGVFAIPTVGALCFGFAFYIALVAALTHRLQRPGEDDLASERLAAALPRVVFFAAAWTIIEWVRGWLLSGFPWNPIATVWSETATPLGLPMIQVTTLIGTYGLGFLTVLAAAAPSVLGGSLRNRQTWLAAVLPLVLLGAIAAGGWWRLHEAPEAFVPGVKLRLVQAAIPEQERQQPKLWETQLRDQLALSTTDRPADTTAVIWGEAAVPPLAFVNVSETYRHILAGAAPPEGVVITGADRGVQSANGEEQIYNSLFVLDHDGTTISTYDKFHLVPFGEYVPLRWLVPFGKVTGGIGDFSFGSGIVILSVKGLPPFTPLICYDTIFSGGVTPSRGPRPKWLLEITNDSWFGTSTGPYQHFAADRLRAVEEGLPLVRDANTGISAVLDGFGRIAPGPALLGLGQRGVLDEPLPEPAAENTLFGTFGNLIPLLLATFGGGGALLARRRMNA